MVIDIAEVKAADAVRRAELRRSWQRGQAHHPVSSLVSRLVGRTRG